MKQKIVSSFIMMPDFIGELSVIQRVPAVFEVSADKCAVLDTPVYDLQHMRHGHSVVGPALLLDRNNTIVVDLNCTATINKTGDLIIHVGAGADRFVFRPRKYYERITTLSLDMTLLDQR